MTDIETIYKKLSHVISKEDFLQRIQEKVENMGGLCDETMAAMLVANELGFSDAGRDSIKIENITPPESDLLTLLQELFLFSIPKNSQGMTGL